MKNILFENDISIVPELYDSLYIANLNGEKYLKGSLNIIDNSGKLWSVFDVEIKGSANYPFSFPKLFETSDLFPKTLDWHVYEDDKSCCVDVLPNEIIVCKDGLNVVDYIKQFAIPYFANQLYRLREGYYLYGEYSHGILGRLEFYQGKLKAKNPAELIEMFRLILTDYDPDRRALCPFCHKKKFRKCHRNAFRDLRNVKVFLHNDGLNLIKYFDVNPNFKLP